MAAADTKGPSRPKRRPSRSVIEMIAYTGGLLVLMALASLWPHATARVVPYSEFKTLLRADRISAVVVSDVRIRGTLKQSAESFVTTRVDDSTLMQDLEQHTVTVTGETAATNWWAPLLMWLVPLGLVWWWVGRTARAVGPGSSALAFGRAHAKIYAEDDVKVTFADVAGIDEATEELREIVDFLRHPEKYTELGGRIPKGVLLLGPPGTGKTLLARAVAGEAKVPFFSLSGSEFVEMFVGVGAARVRDLFAQAEQRAPCIVFIDELDALGRTRAVSPLATHEEREQTLNQLLAEMDGFDPRKGIIVMSATNRPEVLDPALLRPGRFDRRVVVDRPDVRGREAILRLHARAVKLADDVDLATVAARTTGFAGADLANLVNEATLLAARRSRRQVTMGDFEEAIDRVMAGLKRKRVMSPRERDMVATHEAGHAVVASLLPGADPVHKVSIVQRGYDALGHTMQLPLEDHLLRTRHELLDQLAVLLAGTAAEELRFDEMSTGAQNDLRRATELARAMVGEFGMSDAIGPVAVTPRYRSPFLQAPGIEPGEGLAEQTAREVDLEVKRLLVDAHGRARHILQDRRAMLDEVTRLLLEHEVVEGADVRRLVAAGPPAAGEPARPPVDHAA